MSDNAYDKIVNMAPDETPPKFRLTNGYLWVEMSGDLLNMRPEEAFERYVRPALLALKHMSKDDARD